jgi:hypothetical protein
VSVFLHRLSKPARVAAAMRGRSSDRPAPNPPVPGRGPDGCVAPDELHRWRKAWGAHYGSRIRELTDEWKKELR